MLRRFLTLLAVIWALTTPAAAQDSVAGLSARTQDDKGFITRLLEDNLSGGGREVRITGFAGALSSRATFDEMTIADDAGVWLTIRNGALSWNRAALLSRRIEIGELSAAEIDLPRLPASDGTKAPKAEISEFRLPELPVALQVDKIAVDRVVIGQPVFGAKAVVSLNGSVSLAGGDGAAEITAERVDGRRGSLALAGNYGNESRILVMELNLDEEADGIAANLIGLHGRPALKLGIQGDGSIDDFIADIALATDGQDRLTGTVTTRAEPRDTTPGRSFSANLSGDISPLLPPENREFFGTQSKLAAKGWRGEDGRMSLPDLHITTGQAALTGQAEIAAGGAPQLIRMRLAVSPDAAISERTLLPFGGVRMRSGQIDFDFDRAAGDSWTLDGTLRDMRRDDLGIDTLRLTGEGVVAETGGKVEQLDGVVNFTAAGIAPDDPALAQAIGGFLSGRTQMTWVNGGAFRLDTLRVTGDGYSARGNIDFEQPKSGLVARANLRAAYEDIAQLSGLAGRDLSGKAELAVNGAYTLLTGGFDGRATLTGTDITLDQADLDALLRGESTISVDAARSTDGITLRALDIDAEQLLAHAEGVVRTGASDLTATLSLRDLNTLKPAYGGTLEATARLVENQPDPEAPIIRRLTLQGTGRNLRAGIAQLDAALRGETALNIALTETDGLIEIDKLSASNPQISALASGRIGAGQTDARANIRMPDLSVLGKGWGGKVDLDATLVQADGGARRFTLQGSGDNLSLGQRNLDGALTGRTQLTVTGSEQNGTVTLDQATLSGPVLDASAQGVIGKDRTDLSARIDSSDLGAFGTPLRGGLSARATLKGTGSSRSFTAQGTARNLSVGQAQADAVLRGATAFNITGQQSGGRIRIEQARVTNPQLTATADAVIDGATRRVNLDARLADLGVIAPDFPGPATVAGQVTETPAGYDSNLRLTGPGGTSATVSGPLAANFRSGNLAIAGNTDAALAAPFMGDRALDGPIRFDLRLNGPLALESLNGRISSEALRFADPALGLSLPKIALTADLSGGQARLNGRAKITNGGTVEVTGPIALGGARQADLAIVLNGVVIRDPDLYETTLNGRLGVTGPLTGGARVAGQIDLQEAELRVPSTGLGGAGDITKIRHRGDRPPVRSTRRRAGLAGDGSGRPAGGGGGGSKAGGAPVALDITINAPNRVFVRGRGLDAELGGSLRLTGSTARIVPIGNLDLIRGRLDILAKRFVLDEGRITLDGTLVPYIRFAASTVSDDVTSIVTIEGPADDPKIVFSSQPELAEEEVIARLLFSRNLENLSAFQAAQLASAIATLAGKGGEGIVSKIRKGSGLDDLDVTTDDKGEATLKAGKYLSEKVYTDVEVNAKGQSRINLNFDITPNLKARGSTGTGGGSSLGLYYEKDY